MLKFFHLVPRDFPTEFFIPPLWSRLCSLDLWKLITLGFSTWLLYFLYPMPSSFLIFILFCWEPFHKNILPWKTVNLVNSCRSLQWTIREITTVYTSCRIAVSFPRGPGLPFSGLWLAEELPWVESWLNPLWLPLPPYVSNAQQYKLASLCFDSCSSFSFFFFLLSFFFRYVSFPCTNELKIKSSFFFY